MVSSTEDTLLVLQGMGLPHYSARGITQTLIPINAAVDLRRTIDGVLTNLASAQFKKFASKLSCTDMRAPRLDGIWPGMELTVHCVAELCYDAATGTNERPEVSGSSWDDGEGFIRYRPVLIMLVTNFSQQFDEWKSDYQWELDLEEK